MATTVPTLFAAGPERRVALCYFLLMTPLGASVVGAGIWFAENGLDPRQIAVINVAPVLVMIALNLTIGRIADRACDWRQTIVTASAIQGAVTMALFFVDSFWGILAVWTLSVMPNQAIGPVLDAATMRMTRRNGTHFGALRACATVGYMLSVGASGMVIARFGIESFVPLYVGLMLVKALVAQALPFFRAPPGTPPPVERGAERLAEVMRPWFVLPLFGYAMAFGTHIILNAFAALWWKKQGIPADVIGNLIMLGAFAEAAMMFAWGRLGKVLRPDLALLIAAVVAALRWTAMGFAPPVHVLVFLQLLHALTFALGYLGCVSFIATHTRERIAAEAQSFYILLQAIMTVVAVLGFGWIGARLGFAAYFVAGAFALLGALTILAGIALRPAEAEPDRA